MDIPNIEKWLAVIDSEHLWLVKVLALIILTSILSVLSRGFLNRLHEKLGATKNVWDDTFVLALSRPVSLLIWLVGLSLSINIIEATFGELEFQLGEKLRELGLIIILGWFFLRLIKFAQQQLLSDSKRFSAQDKMTVDAVVRLLRFSVFILTALMTLQTLGYSISGVLAFGGIGGLAIGLASKELIANFFGALMIYMDRPFAIGDWIRSPDKSIEGTVEAIGWRVTRIRTFDARPLYVPNAVFTNIIVENPSRMTNRRIYETIGVRYDDYAGVEAIVADVHAMLEGHPDIDHDRTLMVNFNQYNDCSLDFFLYTFTKTTNWQEYHKVKQDVLLKVGQIIESHGAEIAFPTSTLHIPELKQATKMVK